MMLEAQDPIVEEERRRAARLLLARPFLADTGPDPEVFALVRRHQTWLQSWFTDQLGYRLAVDVEFARLHKRPVPGGLPRPARSRSGASFDRRRYALLCLVLAALERQEVQTTLSQLAEEVKLLAASAEGVTALDLDRYAERQGFVDAVRFLVEHGVLSLTDGDDAEFVEGRGDALYDVDARRAAQLLTAPVPPSLAAGPAELATETYPPTDEGANRRIRHRLMRRLLEEPALYFDELDEAERAYLAKQRPYLLGQVQTAVGLPVEVRREGVVLVDAAGVMSDLVFPAAGTVSHAALLLAGFLAERARERGGEGEIAVPKTLLLSETERLLARFGRYWSKVYRDDPRGAERLLDDTLDRLEALRLAERRPEAVRPLPASARFQAVTPEESTDA